MEGEVAARKSLSRHLDPNSPAPLVVAFSGGGDSVGLLLVAKGWADKVGRRVIAVTVDHGLQAAGADWAAWCEARCRRLGVEHRTLVWTGDKPATGLAAAARGARHGLIAQAAREAGARVILMGHTADDRLEARWMRQAGASCPEPREWSPSPLWPEGRGLFILRPLIEARRGAIREALAAAGETWIEDPANIDARYARARARAALAGGGEPGPLADASPAVALLTHVTEGAAGDLTIDRAALTHPAARTLIGAALLCAAGTARPPRGERLDRLMARLAAEDRFVAPLAGARLEAAGPMIRVLRESARLAPPLRLFAGEGDHEVVEGASEPLAFLGRPKEPFSRGEKEGPAPEEAWEDEGVRSCNQTPHPPNRFAVGPLLLPLGEVFCGRTREMRESPGRERGKSALVWDGRFEIEARAPGLCVRALAGHAAKLTRAQRAAVKALPAAARPSLPVVIDEAGDLTCPTLIADPRVTVRSLVFARLAAALGAVDCEGAIGRVAKRPATT